MYQKIIKFLKENLNEIVLVIGVILISLLSFAVGFIVAKQQEKEPIKIETKNPNYKIQMTNKFQNLNAKFQKFLVI